MPSISRRSAFGAAAVLAMGCNQATAQTMAAGQAPLAIKGYDPVAYFTDGRPGGTSGNRVRMGRAALSFRNGRASRTLQGRPRALRAAVRQFLCHVTQPGRARRGRPGDWLISDGRLYIFGRPEGPELFRQNIRWKYAGTPTTTPTVPVPEGTLCKFRRFARCLLGFIRYAAAPCDNSPASIDPTATAGGHNETELEPAKCPCCGGTLAIFPLARRSGRRCRQGFRWRSRATIRSPISLSAKPTPGLPEFEYEWDDHRYRFATAEHRDLFKADPVRYAPQFGNFCAMALAKGELVVANPENWLISDGKLYVFGKPPGRTRPVPEGPRREHRQGEREPAASCRSDLAAGRRAGWLGLRPARARPCADRRAGARDPPASGTCCRTSCGSNVGSRRRIAATTRAASSVWPCCA